MIQRLLKWMNRSRSERRKRLRQAATRNRLALLEPLEARSLLAPLTNTGTASDIVFNLPAATSSIILEDDGIAGNGISQLRCTDNTFDTTKFSNPGLTLTINRGNAADTLTVNALPDFTAGLTIGSAANPFSSVIFAGTISLAPDKNLFAHAVGSIGLPDPTSDISASGTGQISLTTSRDISLSPGASISTVNGNLTLFANQQGTLSSGDFSGVLVSGAAVRSTGTGSVMIFGRGGSSASGGQLFGVLVNAAGVIEGGTSGSLSITGTGGDSDGSVKSGVRLINAGSLVTSAGADVFITGNGGTGGLFNRGVDLFSGAMITAGGSGKVTIVGTGGFAPLIENQGVLINGATTAIASASGDVMVIGTGGGTGAAGSSVGVAAFSGGSIRAGGSGSITIRGIGGNDTTASNGVSLLNVTTGGGDIFITGIALNSAALGANIAGPITPGPGGNVLIEANRLAIAAGGSIDAATGSVTLLPYNPNHPIDLGGPDTPTSLGLSDVDLDLITAATLQIGNAISGAIAITGDITRPASTHVNLASGGAINFTTGSLDTAGGNLTLTPGSTATVGVTKSATDVFLATTGTFSFASGSDLAIALNGPTVDTQYEQLNVAGMVDLTGVDLVLSGTYSPALGESFMLVSNDGDDAVIGTFNGLDNGEVFTIPDGPRQGNYQIVYAGGDGNDVVLTAVNTAPTFVPGLVPSVTDESGPQTIAFASAISAGPPREATQQLTFQIITNTNSSLFAVPPAIDSAGNLTFTPQFNVAGQALITIALKDNGGSANGGSDTSPQITFPISITKARVWHNAKTSLDVTGDGFRVSEDALEVINFLNAFGPQDVPTDGRPNGPYYDTDGDGTVTAGDALDVINFLNAFGADGEGQPPPISDSISSQALGNERSAHVNVPLDDLYFTLARDVTQNGRGIRRR